MYELVEYKTRPAPWNKGKLVGQKAPLKAQQVWAIRIHLQMANNTRDLVLFNLAIDSKLRGCDLVKLRVSDISQQGRIQSRAQIVQQKLRTGSIRNNGANARRGGTLDQRCPIAGFGLPVLESLD